MGPPCQPLLKRQALSLVRDGQTETEREREENGKGWLSTCCAGGSCHLQPWPLGTWTHTPYHHPTPRTVWPLGPCLLLQQPWGRHQVATGQTQVRVLWLPCRRFLSGWFQDLQDHAPRETPRTCPCQWFRVCMVPLCHLNSSMGSTSIPDAPGRGSEDPTVCMGARLLCCWLGQSSQFPNIWPYPPGLQLYLLRGARRAER